MSMNREGRPTRPEAGQGPETATWTGNRALMLEEPLIFEMGEEQGCGVDFDPPSRLREGPGMGSSGAGANSGLSPPLDPFPRAGGDQRRLAGLERNRPIGLPG
ncbi:MAG: glycine dehydrogenase subunit 2, partial [Alphaproteobacteria bacterium]|nr:glycine dehydrogenase subunit 2 [Alphaproteobacteria bacterium]